VVAFAIKLVHDKKNSITNEETPQKPTFSVSKTQEQNETINPYVNYLGFLEATQNPKISTRISGYIQAIEAAENDRVKQGDILLSIDSKEFDQNLEQIKLSLDSLEYSLASLEKNKSVQLLDMQITLQQYQSSEKLYEAGGIAKESLDNSLVNYRFKKVKYESTLDQIAAKEKEIQSLRAGYNAKKEQKQYYVIKAPIDGRIEKISQDIGELTNPALAIISLVGLEQKLTFSFASPDVKVGQEVFVGDDKVGVIDFIYPTSKNFLEVAHVKLVKNLSNKLSANITLRVKIL
jgi:multidrug efflux pump subunit AcrA (membrane-fusion protein)